jgi:hypothetical protein
MYTNIFIHMHTYLCVHMYEYTHINVNVNIYRTWFGWVRNKVLTQTECTFTAVGVVWWASTVLAPFVTKALPKGPKGGMNIMTVVFSLYNNGFEGVLDTVLARISELALHLIVIIITAIVVTFTVQASLTGIYMQIYL